MKKILYLIILGVLVNGCATYPQYSTKHEQFEFILKKRLLFNTYNLQIINHSPNRVIEFYAAKMSDSYLVILNDGSKIRLDSPVFYYIGAKGIYSVYPGMNGSIPFGISKSIIKNANRFVFQGVTYIPKINGNFYEMKDKRLITVTFDIDINKSSVAIGDEIKSDYDSQIIFKNEDTTSELIPGDYNRFRLLKSAEEESK